MPVSSADLWKLLRQSRLLSPQRLDQIHEAFAQSGSRPDQVPAKALAQWLIQRQMLTAYQANLLLNGRAGPFRYGDYQIQDRVRGGRLAKTFLAVHVPTRYGVQLKFASSQIAQDPRQWNAARQYVRAVSQIVDNQLQRVFALDEQASHRFLVLERLLGQTVAERLAQQRPLPVSEACQIARLAALGLGALHEQQQVHGDLRPGNLWLESRRGVKLLRDNFLPPAVPALWQAEATPEQLDQAAYMAPELAHPGTPVSPATDVYSLGCNLYELLQGHPPLRGRNAAESLQQRADEAIPPVRAQPIDQALLAILNTMLAKEPSARPAHAAEVADSLLPFIESSQRHIPELAPSATLLAYEQVLGQGTAPAAPAPPPVISEPDDHPTLEEPPVQAPAAPAHMTQEVQPFPTESREPAAAQTTPPIDVVSLPRHTKARKRTRRNRASQRKQAIVLSVLAFVLLGAAGVFVALEPRLRTRLWGSGEQSAQLAPQAPSPRSGDRPSHGSKRSKSPSSSAPSTRYELRNDDGKLLWKAPTNGPAVQLQYLAPGTQTLLIVRPHDILGAANGPPVIKALGPGFDSYRKRLEASAGVELADIEQLVVSLHTTDVAPAFAIAFRLLEPRPIDELLAAWGDPAARDHAGVVYYDAGDWSFFIPDQDSVSRFVMADQSLIHEIIQGQDKPPLMRRELARLLQITDRQQHLSVLSSLDALDQEWHAVKTSPRYSERLQESLIWLLSDDVRAYQLNMQFGEQYFVELRAYGLAAADGGAVAEALRERLDNVPQQIETLLTQVYPSPYWRRVALRLPEMVRFLLRYTRVGVEDGTAIANAILPGEAAHNLVFATEMLLSTGARSANTTSTAAELPPAPTSLEELIERSMDLSFDQKSLEFAIQDLATDIRETYPSLPFPFDIQILGSDLQLEGITRNQQIAAFRAEGQTIAEILTAIVMRANPVTTVTDPADADQKLVWVVGPDPVDPKRRILLITTRDAALREGYKLAAPFQPK
jgi:hypothetical protein